MFIKKYENGDAYFGELSNNHKDGIGVFYSPGSSIYIGRFSSGKTAGVGVAIDRNRRIFTDKEQSDFFEKHHNDPYEFFIYRDLNPNQVYGIMKFQKLIFKGFFDSNVQFKQGTPITGTLIKETTHYVAKGAFSSGGLEGVGEFLSNMEHYMGYFSGGVKSGLGYTKRIGEKHNLIARYVDGVETGEAIEWIQNDIMIRVSSDGRTQGYIRYKNGDMYIGDLKEVTADQENGDHFENGDAYDQIDYKDSQMIRTRFKKFVKHGFGSFYKNNNDYYTGGWEMDQKSGIGLDTCFEPPGKDGDQLEKFQFYGHFAHNRRNGFGKLTLADGQSYQGNFNRDSMNGTIRFTESSTEDTSPFGSKFYLYHENNRIAEATPDKISEFKKTEAAQSLFGCDDFKAYSLRKQAQLETIITDTKNGLIEEFTQMSSILKGNYDLFKRIEADTNDHFMRRARLSRAVEDIRLQLFHNCQDPLFAVVLKDPLHALQMFLKSNEDLEPQERPFLKQALIDRSAGPDLFTERDQKDSFVKNFLNLIDKRPGNGSSQSPMKVRDLPKKDLVDHKRQTLNKNDQFKREFPAYFNKLLERNVRSNATQNQITKPYANNQTMDLKVHSMIAEIPESSKTNPRSFIELGSSQRAPSKSPGPRTKTVLAERDSVSKVSQTSRLTGQVNEEPGHKSPRPNILQTKSARPRLNANEIIEQMNQEIHKKHTILVGERSPSPNKTQSRQQQRERIEARKKSLSDQRLPLGLMSLDPPVPIEPTEHIFNSRKQEDTKEEIEEVKNSLLMQFMSQD